MSFILLSIYENLGFENQHYFFGLPIKKPNLINIIFVVWDTSVIYDFRRGCLGACLWEWLAVGVWDPKWSVPR